ncbi:MAG: tetratricopeptide repeat protein [Acidobacteria bacterium]|nr:tetratricopeptide repeat protein [Acidobacteriota bacterium]
MTANKDLKKIIRARQEKTGESYTTARLHVLRTREVSLDGKSLQKESIAGYILKCNQTSIRVHIPESNETLTMRTNSVDAWHAVPGQCIEAIVTNRWTWRGVAYASGAVNRLWTNVRALGLEPLPLEDEGFIDLTAMSEPFEKPDPYAEMWDFFVSVPRKAFKFHEIAWGAGIAEDPEGNLVQDASEISGYDPSGARQLLTKTLSYDLRCIDAHAHLGNLCFDHWPKVAMAHYEVGIGVGDLSLGRDFNALLPWGYIYNRPYLRCLHGYGLCLWRLGSVDKARAVFERILSLNPIDNQGIRFLWDDIRNGRHWKASDEAEKKPTLA